MSKNKFVCHYGVGRGAFGKVWKVELRRQKQVYAMKEMSKARIISKRSIKSVINELKILSKLKDPLIVNMHYAFQDRDNLYLVMDFLSKGDLRFHLCNMRKFDENTTRFFIACLV